MPHDYIIVMRDTHYCIVGPFDSVWAIHEWAGTYAREAHDPRWQTITLADPHAAPRVLAPTDPAAIAAIQE